MLHVSDDPPPSATGSTASASAAARRPRLLSGMQPTADSLHLGNYLGALRHWVALQDGADATWFVADLHALTRTQDPALLRERTRRVVAQYLAAGIDPERSTIFVQSHVLEHAQLAWALQCLTGFGEASRMTQFKDKVAKDGDGSGTVGLFAYPVLQAADILAHDPDLVPVGEDQRQHLELTRTLAQRFNQRYGEALAVPRPHIVGGTAKITDLQDPTAKMSKSSPSQSGVLNLLDSSKVMAKKIRSAVTDTGRDVLHDREDKPGVTNLLDIHSALSGTPVVELVERFEGRGYGDLKVEVAEVVTGTLGPLRDRALGLLEDPDGLDAILADGAERARARASDVLARVNDRLGLLPRVGAARTAGALR